MNFLKRFGFYMGGFAMGLVILSFVLSGKRASCAYGPNARVLKNLRSKTLVFSETAEHNLTQISPDRNAMQFLLRKGDVAFSESQTQLDSCRVYVVYSNWNNLKLKGVFENCDSIARVTHFTHFNL